MTALNEQDMQNANDAVNEAIHEQIVSLLFTEDQLKDMEKPYHSPYDHYGPAHLISIDGVDDMGGLKPQLSISDPRITDEMIENLPETIDVEWKGKNYTIPLRVFKWGHAKRMSVSEWEDALEKVYDFRKLAEKLEKSLSDKFNLAANKDFHLGMGKSIKGDCLMVQTQSDEAWKKRDAIHDHLEKELAKTPEGQIYKEISIMGPIELH